MPTPRDAGKAIAKTADAISARTAKQFVPVMRASERALIPVLQKALKGNAEAKARAVRGLTLLTDIREALTNAGLDDFIETSSTTAVQQMAQALKRRTKVAGIQEFIMPNAKRIAALADVGAANLFELNLNIATALNRAVSLWSLTVTDQDAILRDLASIMKDNFNEAQTLFDTQVSIYGRQLEAMSTENEGPQQAFLYTGPVDGRTRDWCLERVGRVFTRADIEAMDNNQLPNPFITGGGYNCRHSWLPVEGADIEALVGTSKRAEGFDVDMEEIKAMRREAQRNDAVRRELNRNV